MLKQHYRYLKMRTLPKKRQLDCEESGASDIPSKKQRKDPSDSDTEEWLVKLPSSVSF